ncbi:unnamed protein product, partial [Medioppia subpectinata]
MLYLSAGLLLSLCLTIGAETVDVKTSSGTVRGQTIVEMEKRLNVFLGIPFAEPPVGALRFARPHPITKPAPGIIDATKKKTSCLGGDQPVAEDCLFVNIWAPHNTTGALKPVMFWIYGGGFQSGSIFSDMYNGKSLAASDVVYVSVDYRLGSLGFLYGGDDVEAPGNLGLLDQLEGLKWVRQNIHLFGGDRERITVFGESAGSISVSALVLCPLARGLFKRAILESGAQLWTRSHTHTKSAALAEARRMATHFKCTDDNTWLDCLRNVSAKEVHDYPGITVGPLVGTHYMPILAQEAFNTGKYNTDVDLMAGVTRNEGSFLAPRIAGNFTKDILKAAIKWTVGDTDVNKVLDFYLNGTAPDNYTANRWAYYDIFGDTFMKCNTYLFAKQVAQHSPRVNVYFWEQTYQSGGHLQGCDEKTMGICHGSDLEFVFFRTGANPKLDIPFSKEWITLWTNFAKTGVPTSDKKWPKLVNKA